MDNFDRLWAPHRNAYLGRIGNEDVPARFSAPTLLQILEGLIVAR
jgi:hypothetical protein